MMNGTTDGQPAQNAAGNPNSNTAELSVAQPGGEQSAPGANPGQSPASTDVNQVGKPEETSSNGESTKDKKVDFQELNKILLEELHKFFRPELLNRFDELVVFKPLSQDDMSSIAKLGIAKTSKLLKDQGFGVEISDKALDVLAKEGYDPVYGARPLRRLIQTSIENPIALEIIGKKFMPDDTILIDYDEASSKFTLLRKAPPEENPSSEGASDVPQPPTDNMTVQTQDQKGNQGIENAPSAAVPNASTGEEVTQSTDTTPLQPVGPQPQAGAYPYDANGTNPYAASPAASGAISNFGENQPVVPPVPAAGAGLAMDTTSAVSAPDTQQTANNGEGNGYASANGMYPSSTTLN